MKRQSEVKLSDVARLAKVSCSAAGKVLNGGSDTIRVGEEARQRILAAARKLEYRPNMAASILAGGNSRLVGVMIDPITSFRNLALLQAIERICAERSYRIIISSAHDNVRHMEESYRMLLHYGVAGIICCAHDYPQFRKEITALFEGESKIVFMEKPAFSSRSYVATSREAALTFMIAEAIRNGFRKIGMICASRIWSSEKILCEEFRAAMKKNKLTIKEDLIVEYPEEKLPEICDRCDWVMEKMILPLRPDFLYVDDALHAVSLQSRLQNAGIDLTIYGGNHDPLYSNVIPAIQSFDPQYDKIAEKLLNRILTPDSSAEPEIVEACYRKNHST